MTGRITVVGLGPAGADLLLVAARDALAQCERRYVRTARHPAVDDLIAEGMTFDAFDGVYERAATFDDVYAEIADTLVAEAVAGDIVYAVPGSPTLAESTVQGLLVRANAAGVDVVMVPGLSFADLAWARVGVDEMERGRILDGHRFVGDAVGASGPVLIAQVDDAFIASDVKLALLEVLPPDAPVTILQRLGLPDEFVATVPLAECDHDLVPDHLTSLFVDLGDATIGAAITDLITAVRTLRGPGGCPWYQEQTHRSLAEFVLEEAYETVDALEGLPPDAPGGEIEIGVYDDLEGELGDLLYQAVLHAVLAEEAGAFTLDDVARRMHAKIVHRNPHVFADAQAETVEDVFRIYAAMKRDEGQRSAFSSIPNALPALQVTRKLVRKAMILGLPGEVLLPDPQPDQELGATLAALAAQAEIEGVDADAALRAWNTALRDRLTAFEATLGADPCTLAPDEITARWHASA